MVLNINIFRKFKFTNENQSKGKSDINANHFKR